MSQMWGESVTEVGGCSDAYGAFVVVFVNNVLSNEKRAWHLHEGSPKSIILIDKVIFLVFYIKR